MALPINPATYTPRSAFLDFHNRPTRWATMVTHRRAGKTVALANDLVLAARTPINKPDPQYAYVGPTFTQAKRIAWNYLKRYSAPYWSKDPSESELKITIHPNTTIYCLGADNADSLRGMYLDGFMGDEYALWRPSVFSQVIRPALSDRAGWGVFASTPRGKNLFHDVYRQALRYPEEHQLTVLRASTSGIIPQTELADLRRTMDAEEFAQEYECSFDSALKGAIYASEVNQLMADQRVHQGPAPLYDPALPTHFVYDLGFTDATVRIAYQLPPLTGRVNIVNVEASQGQDIFAIIQSLTDFAEQAHGAQAAGVGTIWLPHDARAKNLQTGKSIVEQFLSHSFTPRIVPNHKVHDGISAVRRLFPRLVVDCTPLDPLDPHGFSITGDFLEAAKTYHREWDDDRKMFLDIPYHDWSSDYMDALRYVAMTLPADYALLTTSDDGRADAEYERSRIWTPNLGYNLETLHADSRQTADVRRLMA